MGCGPSTQNLTPQQKRDKVKKDKAAAQLKGNEVLKNAKEVDAKNMAMIPQEGVPKIMVREASVVAKEHKEMNPLAPGKDHHIADIRIDPRTGCVVVSPVKAQIETTNSTPELIKASTEAVISPEATVETQKSVPELSKVASQAAVAPPVETIASKKSMPELTKATTEAVISPEATVETQKSVPELSKVASQTAVAPPVETIASKKSMPELTKATTEAVISPEATVETQKSAPELSKVASQAAVAPVETIPELTKASTEALIATETNSAPAPQSSISSLKAISLKSDLELTKIAVETTTDKSNVSLTQVAEPTPAALEGDSGDMAILNWNEVDLSKEYEITPSGRSRKEQEQEPKPSYMLPIVLPTGKPVKQTLIHIAVEFVAPE